MSAPSRSDPREAGAESTGEKETPAPSNPTSWQRQPITKFTSQTEGAARLTPPSWSPKAVPARPGIGLVGFPDRAAWIRRGVNLKNSEGYPAIGSGYLCCEAIVRHQVTLQV
jgi:hypothetical protein